MSFTKKASVAIASIAASSAAGAVGTLATIPNIPTWYASLEKPALVPPNFVFGPVWSLLYAIMGIALAIIVLSSSQRSKRSSYVWFAVQLILNALWSLVFFGLHSFIGGVVIVLLLLASIMMTMYYFHKIKPVAAWLLLPYLTWVSFATYLTVALSILNT